MMESRHLPHTFIKVIVVPPVVPPLSSSVKTKTILGPGVKRNQLSYGFKITINDFPLKI